ncbi:MAG: helix-turn-helix domain-containing protein [Candidatus Thermoplasmatota archaeon]|nr:helix-turn-helix domain-containing protein [Candidatus Thermoplasmatota archaeon]MCL5788998.1 helix-turn-helix domain-containing protein [Candidatus Thermoplasmatota archaeon]
MTRRMVWEVRRHISESDLLKAIKSERVRARIVPRLMFIRLLYKGMSVPKASSEMKIQKRLGYIWLKKWNNFGIDGLIPMISPGGPRRLSDEQLKQLKDDLSSGSWTTEDVRKHIEERFRVIYSARQVSRILKGFNMHHSEPYPHDYRKPKNAEDNVKEL